MRHHHRALARTGCNQIITTACLDLLAGRVGHTLTQMGRPNRAAPKIISLQSRCSDCDRYIVFQTIGQPDVPGAFANQRDTYHDTHQNNADFGIERHQIERDQN